MSSILYQDFEKKNLVINLTSCAEIQINIKGVILLKMIRLFHSIFTKENLQVC